ncbi:MAG: SH3 domain-containing protein [Acidobacteriota bacterium]
MTKSTQSEASRSHVLFLLEQQKYDEALPILGDLKEKDPSDRDIRMCYLLVLRIIVLRWNLSRATTGPVNYACAMVETTIRRFASVVRVFERRKLVQSFGRIYEAGKASFANRRTRHVIIAGAGSVFLLALVAFYRASGSDVAVLIPSTLLASTDASLPTFSVSAANTYYPAKAATTDEDVRQTRLSTAADERTFIRVISEPSEFLRTELSTTQGALKGHLQDYAEQEPTLSGADGAKATPQVDTSNAFAKRQQRRALLNIQSSGVAANENNGNKDAREILGHYQSRRAIPIRKSPRFAAATVTDIDSGISLNVLEFVGSWAKVQLRSAGITGFVRKEFLIAIEKTGSNVTHSSPSVEETPNA